MSENNRSTVTTASASAPTQPPSTPAGRHPEESADHTTQPAVRSESKETSLPSDSADNSFASSRNRDNAAKSSRPPIATANSTALEQRASSDLRSESAVDKHRSRNDNPGGSADGSRRLGAPLSRRSSAAPTTKHGVGGSYGEASGYPRPGGAINVVDGRSVSRSGGHAPGRRADSENDDDDDDILGGDHDIRNRSVSVSRARAMSPAPALANPSSRPEEDDEVERIDRGEELVRKRMKDRARMKKETEKARKREAMQLSQGSSEPSTRHSSYHPTSYAVDYEARSAAASSAAPQSPRPAFLRGQSSSRAVSSSSAGLHATALDRDATSDLSNTKMLPSTTSRRLVSKSGLRESVVTPTTPSTPVQGYEFGSRDKGGYFPSMGRTQDTNPTPHGDQDDFKTSTPRLSTTAAGYSTERFRSGSRFGSGAFVDQAISGASSSRRQSQSVSLDRDAHTEPHDDVISFSETVSSPYTGDQDEMDGDIFHDRHESSSATSHATQRARHATSVPRSEASEMIDEAVETDFGSGRDDFESGAGETEDASDDEDIGADGEVEYTLKDRQDAINVEHPFGLPIWKPALYKKSRSITRNAETALHATPSTIALRHLAPGNILWTVLFGSGLAFVCVIVSAILWLVPWGGEKYGRVIWELAGYLFWPFGKYVEGWTEGEGDEVEVGSPADVNEDPRSEAGDTPRRIHDEEEAGRTFSRGRARDFAQLHEGSSLGQSDRWENASNDPSASQERMSLLGSRSDGKDYGATRVPSAARNRTPSSSQASSDETISGPTWRPHDFSKDGEGRHSFRVRALGRVMYWVTFYLIVAPLMLFVCILCWGMVFTIPMAKLLWVLLRHLDNEPLSLHFRSPPDYIEDAPDSGAGGADNSQSSSAVHYPLRPGQPAPKVSRKEVDSAKRHGRLIGPHSTVLLCTYRAAGAQYYKYTIDGVNILFINLLSLVAFVIIDFLLIAPWVATHQIGGLLAIISGKGFMFATALLSVIPLSYFIGMAVASISAQSSIGMGAVINASFGSIIEIILYSIALADGKANLVEGSLIGSILAGVLLMPGASMIGGAMRRKEQRFNARSAGVTSTMLIMAIVGILTPTLFYEIYGAFQLTCTGCDATLPNDVTSCSTCYYEHVDPADDDFYRRTVKPLAYYCAILLVLSYLIGLWFSLRTHASQIWQNAQHKVEEGPRANTSTLTPAQTTAERQSMYKRLLPNQFLPQHYGNESNGAFTTPSTPHPRPPAQVGEVPPSIALPSSMSPEDFTKALDAVAAVGTSRDYRPVPSALSAHDSRDHGALPMPPVGLEQRSLPEHQHQQTHHRHTKEASKHEHDAGAEEGAGGHDAPNWSRMKSASVLMICTALYAMIAEILVDVVDVVLEGSGIPEKFLGVTLFALVPNTTEFMNAISFAINGNIALSMEIGSAYALQVCLIQAPAMLAFSAFYAIKHESLLHHTFTLVFPRWDVIAIMFSVFLLTYTYIEARANYYRGSILCLSYLVLMGGFAWAPDGRDTSDNPGFALLQSDVLPGTMSAWQKVKAIASSIPRQ